MNHPLVLPNYELVDSGAGEKLERFGERMIVRPSTLAIWKKRRPDEWKFAAARYNPDSGWSFKKERFETWQVDFDQFKFELSLQTNGQVGIFPEHFSYLSELPPYLSALARTSSERPRVLNLFAYTGMATMLAAGAGAQVTHIDNSKKVLTWAKNNHTLSGLPENSIRIINEDALKFVQREIKRESRYSVVIADPPSFSRMSKTDSWNLDEIIVSFMRDLLSLLDPAGGVLVFSCHHSGIGNEVLCNIMHDLCGGPGHRYSVEGRHLHISEVDSPRVLPAGFVAIAKISGALVSPEN